MVHQHGFLTAFVALGCTVFSVAGLNAQSSTKPSSATPKEVLKPAFDVRAKSVPGTTQVCKNKGVDCPIVVRVTSECIAIVDMETVKVAKETTIKFLLVRSDMSDTQTYKFAGKGIMWVSDEPSSADELTYSTLSGGGTVAEWKAGKTKSAKDLAYWPLVERVSDSTLCKAGDPKIANDG